MQKIKKFFSGVVGKKSHVEFITALLSIPVLLTVILLNLNNLNQKKEVQPTPKQDQIIISLPAQGPTSTPIPTKAACKAGVGTVTIAYPNEGDTISDYPVPITIAYNPGDFCAAVWSYRANGGNWSDYDNNSLSLYDLPSGNVTFELRVKSIVDGSQGTTITRHFTYKSPKVTPSATPTNTPVSTATPTQIAPSPTGQ